MKSYYIITDHIPKYNITLEFKNLNINLSNFVKYIFVSSYNDLDRLRGIRRIRARVDILDKSLRDEVNKMIKISWI